MTETFKTFENEQITQKIVEGIQEKKGKHIVILNMNKLKDPPCKFFVICEGDSNVHVKSIALSIKDYVNDQLDIKPIAAIGFDNSEWIAMDYGQIIVHVFQPELRKFYDIEQLWADAELQKIAE